MLTASQICDDIGVKSRSFFPQDRIYHEFSHAPSSVLSLSLYSGHFESINCRYSPSFMKMKFPKRNQNDLETKIKMKMKT
mmetsp:Transcript_10045/g.15179  ORF Transcript_10045/g.15179 Transcript_10045/m.15179 type:complete len:80 (-) Transcript_10045:47-286(-)